MILCLLMVRDEMHFCHFSFIGSESFIPSEDTTAPLSGIPCFPDIYASSFQPPPHSRCVMAFRQCLKDVKSAGDDI